MKKMDLDLDASVSKHPKKMALYYVAILTVIAVAVVVCAVCITDGDDHLRTNLRVGDYIEYEHIVYQGDIEVKHYIARYEIVSVEGDMYRIKDTTDGRTTYEWRDADSYLDLIRFRDSEMFLFNFEGTYLMDTFKGEMELQKYTDTFTPRISFYADSDNVRYEYLFKGHEKAILRGTSLL